MRFVLIIIAIITLHVGIISPAVGRASEKECLEVHDDSRFEAKKKTATDNAYFLEEEDKVEEEAKNKRKKASFTGSTISPSSRFILYIVGTDFLYTFHTLHQFKNKSNHLLLTHQFRI